MILLTEVSLATKRKEPLLERDLNYEKVPNPSETRNIGKLTIKSNQFTNYNYYESIEILQDKKQGH